MSWVDSEPEDATAFVAKILNDESEMVRRIGIYVLGQRWSVLKSLYINILTPQLFDSSNIHELYHLLKDRFSEFSEEDKASTLEKICQLSAPPDHEDPCRFLKIVQRNWLSSVVGKGYDPIDCFFTELDTDLAPSTLSEHPDFHTYTETWSGPGPSPYSIQELLAFSENDSLIEHLNGFEQPDTWRGPSTEALVKSLEGAVEVNPHNFLRLLSKFQKAKRQYQYGVINGFRRLWDGSKEKQPYVDWDVAFKELIGFFENLLSDPDFWSEEVTDNQVLTPTRDWIPPIIAEFLRAGVKDTEKAIPLELLPRTFSLIKILLEKLEATDNARDDAMGQAINSPKGKTIEALFSYALKVCRVSDKESGSHVKAWENIKSTFDVELDKCKNFNYEFSTLAGAYFANIDYLSSSWLRIRIDKIFPKEFLPNFLCAVDGLAYSAATQLTYTLLLEHGVLDQALTLELKGRYAREKIIERIALAYLWDLETLDSPRFSFLFRSSQLSDLENVSKFFRSVRSPELKEGQIELILLFWGKCLDLAKTLDKPPKSLFSQLSRLTCYVTTMEEREFRVLLAVAPYVAVVYYADYFIEELYRLADQEPGKVSSVLGMVLEEYVPSHDYKDHLKKLLLKLANSGRRTDALRYVDQLIELSGFDQVFKELTGQNNGT